MWTTVLSWLGNLLGGPFIQAALDAYKAKLAASTSAATLEEQLAAAKLQVKLREDELNAQIVTTEQSSWFTKWVRPLWAAPFVIWTWKVVVWDNVLGKGVTDPLGGQAAQLCMIIAGAYFVGRSAEVVTNTLTKSWAARQNAARAFTWVGPRVVVPPQGASENAPRTF